MSELICPICNLEVDEDDGTYGVHYNSGLLQCPSSRQPCAETVPEPPRKAPAKRKK